MTMTTDRGVTVTLPADNQILITREFDAPRHLVYRAYTEPDLIRRWWHAGRGEMTDCRVDLRVGGTYRFAMNASEGGFEVAFHGEFHELVQDERVVASEHYEGAPPGSAPAHNTVSFAENAAGGTTMTMLMELESQEVRDMILATGMTDGLSDALALLEEAVRA